MGGLMINCDLGENEDAVMTAQLMERIDAANICCGVHAGSVTKTEATLKLAQRVGVKIGAHPGLGADGGRGAGHTSPSELKTLLVAQLGQFMELAKAAGAKLHHVKIHGALYSAMERDPALAEVYLDYVAIRKGHPGVFALAGGSVAAAARKRGIPVWEEIFADRGYTANGALVPRGQPGALIADPEIAVARLQHWQRTGRMPSVDGGEVALTAGTVCVHSDSPGALTLLEGLKAGNCVNPRNAGST